MRRRGRCHPLLLRTATGSRTILHSASASHRGCRTTEREALRARSSVFRNGAILAHPAPVPGHGRRPAVRRTCTSVRRRPFRRRPLCDTLRGQRHRGGVKQSLGRRDGRAVEGVFHRTGTRLRAGEGGWVPYGGNDTWLPSQAHRGSAAHRSSWWGAALLWGCGGADQSSATSRGLMTGGSHHPGGSAGTGSAEVAAPQPPGRA